MILRLDAPLRGSFLSAFLLFLTVPAFGQAIRTNPGFNQFSLGPNDDNPDLGSPETPLGFSINFFGKSFNTTYVNNNGNISFGAENTAFTPESFQNLRQTMIAPFWADVDTTGAGSGVVRYGRDTVNGRPAFGANYINVGYYAARTNKLNSFQVVLIDRSDTGAGNFDIEFNYGQIQWETGDFDGGQSGLGGLSASAGWSNGTGQPGTWFAVPGSLIPGSFLDTNPNGLIHRRLNSTVDGRLVFEARNGVVSPTCPVMLNPSTAQYGSAGGQGNFVVTSTCSWTATSNAEFITVTGGASATGTATVSYSVGSYSGNLPRSGTITVSDRTFTVTQNGVPCTSGISPSSQTFPAAGGAGRTTVAITAGCAWTATSNVPWAHITAGRNGSLSGIVEFSVDPNTGQARSGTLTIAGQTFTINQESGAACTTTLSPSSASYQSGGTANATVRVNTPCAWTAATTTSWIHITAGTNGNGPGTVTYSVDANGSGSARTGTMTIGGQTFTVSQAVPACPWSVSDSIVSVGSGQTSRTFSMNAPGACSRTVVSNSPFITVTSGNTGTGPGTFGINIAANTTPNAREGTVTAAGRTITIRQQGAGAFSCTAETPPARQIRREAIADLTSDYTFVCNGAAPAAITGDVLITFNTNATSKVIDLEETVEAVLLIDEPAAPALGVNAFLGKAAANNAIRFSGIPLALAGANTNRKFRLSNLRVDGNAAPAGNGSPVTATVQLSGTAVPVGLTNASQNVATVVQALAASFGGAGAPVNNRIPLPVNFSELVADAFKLKGSGSTTLGGAFTTESGYVNAALGSKVGVADSATRLMARLNNIPLGARVFAQVFPSGSSNAQLVSQDPDGNGIGYLTGTIQELAVENNAATATWEVLSVNPGIEALGFNLYFEGVSAQQVGQIVANSLLMMGPAAPVTTAATALPVPRFKIPGVPRNAVSLRVGAGVHAAPADAIADPRNRPVVSRQPDTSRLIEIEVTAFNDTNTTLTNTVVRANLPPGTFFAGSCDAGDGGGICRAGGGGLPSSRNVVIEYPELSPGAAARARIAAFLENDAVNGSLVEVEVSSSNDISVTSDSTQQCIEGIGSLPQPSAAGSTGTIGVFACGPWTITSNVNWITFNPASGVGNSTTTYTILPNTGGARSGTVSFPGGTLLITQPAAGGGGGNQGLQFLPVTPCRVVDTRNPNGPFGGPILTGGATRTFLVPQSGCNIPNTAQAYSVNVTVVPSGPLSYLSMWPAGQPQPLVSTLNSFRGFVVANAAIVPAGDGGGISVFVTDNSHVIIDINGYFAPAGTPGGQQFYRVNPCRIADTRNPNGAFGGPQMPGGSERNFPVPASACGIPAGASAYSLNMTAVPVGHLGFLTTWPTGQQRPFVSTLNSFEGFIVANAAIVPAGANGGVSAFVTEAADVIIDINGYFGPPGPGGLNFYKATPCRVADTRNANAPFGGPILNGGATRSFNVPQSACSIPGSAQAYALNVTVVPSGPLAYLSTWPTGQPQPLVSTLNSFQGYIVANAAIVPSGAGGAVSVFVTDPSHVILDINGYFAP